MNLAAGGFDWRTSDVVIAIQLFCPLAIARLENGMLCAVSSSEKERRNVGSNMTQKLAFASVSRQC